MYMVWMITVLHDTQLQHVHVLYTYTLYVHDSQSFSWAIKNDYGVTNVLQLITLFEQLY